MKALQVILDYIEQPIWMRPHKIFLMLILYTGVTVIMMSAGNAKIIYKMVTGC